MTAREGPDEKTVPPVSRGRPPSSSSPTPPPPQKQKPAESHSTTNRRQCDADTVAGLRRRRRALGLEPMTCGHVDPLTCLARRPIDLTGHQLRAWRLAITHLADLGLTAIVPAAVRQELYALVGGDL